MVEDEPRTIEVLDQVGSWRAKREYLSSSEATQWGGKELGVVAAASVDFDDLKAFRAAVDSLAKGATRSAWSVDEEKKIAKGMIKSLSGKSEKAGVSTLRVFAVFLCVEHGKNGSQKSLKPISDEFVKLAASLQRRGSRKTRKLVHRTVQFTAHQVPWLLEECLRVADSAAAEKDFAPTYVLLACANDVLRFSELAVPTEEQRNKCLRLATAAAMKGGEAAGKTIAEIAPALLATYSTAEIEKEFIPQVSRSLLRERETALGSLPFFINCFSADLSTFVEKLAPPLLSGLKSDKESERAASLQIYEALARKCRDFGALETIFTGLIELLLGKTSSATNRVVAANALLKFFTVILELPEAQNYSSLGETASHKLAEWLSGKEKNEEARAAGTKAMVASLGLTNKPPSKEVSTVVEATLERKKSEAELSALLGAMANFCTPPLLVPEFCDRLPVIIMAKKTTRLDCTNALFLLMQIYKGKQEVPKEVQTALQHGTNIREGPVLSQRQIPSSQLQSEADSIPLLRLCENLLQTAAEHEKDFGGTEQRSAEAIVQMCLSPSSVVSAKAERVAKALSFSTITAAKALTKAIWDVEVKNGNARAKLQADDGVISQRLLRVAALCSGRVEAPVVPYLMLIVHHPVILLDGKKPKLVSLKSLPAASEWLDTATELCLSEEGILSKIEDQVQGAFNALKTVARLCGRNAVDVALPRLLDLLGVDEISALSVSDLENFRSAATHEHVPNGAGDVDEKENTKKGDSKSKGKSAQKGPGSSKDKQAGRSQNDKKKAQEDAKRLQATEEEQENEAVERVTILAHRASAALYGICALCQGAPLTMRSETPRLLTSILTVAKTTLAEARCRGALESIAACAPDQVAEYQEMISTSLYELCVTDKAMPATTLLTKISETSGLPLEAEAFCLILPVIGSAITKPEAAEDGSVDKALELLEAHVVSDAISAAVACANAGAGHWMLSVLEREDSLFSRAMKALGDLAENALTVGPLLEQVLSGVRSGKASVREASLEALDRLPELHTGACRRDASLGRTLWLAKHDVDESLAALGESLLASYGHPLSAAEDLMPLLELVMHPEKDVRTAAARSTADLLKGEVDGPLHNLAIARLFKIYVDNLPREEEQVVNRVVRRGKSGKSDSNVADRNWHAREGVAMALKELAEQGALSSKHVTLVFTFLSSRGLGDSNDEVRASMAQTAISVVHAASSEAPALLLPMIEGQLKRVPSKDETRDVLLHIDRTHENLVVCLGTVASYLPSDESGKITEIAQLLMKTAMESQSEPVQRACSRCIAAIAKALEPEEAKHRDFLLGELFGEGNFSHRRGAAYALAGVLQGLGLQSMKRMGVSEQLKSSLSGKSPAVKKQSALFLVETVAQSLEGLFEPYFVTMLPLLLQSMNDVSDVRQASWQASGACMASLSAHGVRLVLPSLMDGLKERSWRTKASSADMLGAMAFCAPRQLAQSLPIIVPRLAEALADAHPKVIEAAEAAVSRIAAVTSNPEVRSLSPFLLAALRDPAGKTSGAIDAMLQTEFVHLVDPASLALLVPPLHRALKERSSELKKRAAAIAGSMCAHATDPTDVVPYLDFLLPDLKTVLLDPIPEVRSTSASALGSLAEGIGTELLPGLLEWLLASVIDVNLTTAERSGAALGLAAVSNAMNDIRINHVMQATVSAPNAAKSPAETLAAKEGALLLLASMPGALRERFEVRLNTALPIVLKGLADEADNVREAALSAGRSIVGAFGRSSLERLLPLLCEGMQDDFWRIRQNSTQLLGDLLLSLSGAKASVDGTVVMEEPDEDEEGEEKNEDGSEDEEDTSGIVVSISPAEVMSAMTTALGYERRNEVIATLYLARNDVSVRVRMAAIQVWKMVVFNTPRTLREILSAATTQIIQALSSSNEERRAIAARALGDLGQKLGDQVFPQVLPLLRESLSSPNDGMRRGACEGLAELVTSASKAQLTAHSEDLLPPVEDALCDPLDEVRMAAAGIFASLSRPLGYGVSESVVMSLVAKASQGQRTTGAADEEDEDADGENAENFALDGLQKVLAVCSHKLVSSVILRLISERPMTTSGMLAVAASARVSQSHFEAHLKEVVAALVGTFVELGSELSEEHLDGAKTIFESIAEAGNAEALLAEVLSPLSHNTEMRIAGARLVGVYCRALGPRVGRQARTILEALIRQLADVDMDAVVEAWRALQILTAEVPAAELSLEIGHIRQFLRQAAISSTYRASDGGEGDRIAGLCIPKGPGPFVIPFTEGLLHGPPELREQAALAIAELVELSEQKPLSPYVVKLTGPLIRVISDRFPWQVKAAILHAMLRLLQRCAPMVKMLIPQLQSIFLKNLSDSTRTVRKRSVAALAELSKIHPRPEPMMNDLIALATSGEQAAGSRAAAVRALGALCRNAPKLPPSAMSSIPQTVVQSALDEDEEMRSAADFATNLFLARMDSAEQDIELLALLLGSEEPEHPFARIGKLSAIEQILRSASTSPEQKEALASSDECSAVADEAERALGSPDPLLKQKGLAVAAEMFVIGSHGDRMMALIEAKIRQGSAPVDVRVAALQAAARCGSAPAPPFERLAPLIVAAGREKNTMIKYKADKALRGLFLEPSGADRPGAYESAEAVLSAELSEWLSDRLVKLQATPESDEEQEDEL